MMQESAFHKEDKIGLLVALALHVDYWDYIGWKGSFAKPEFAARQRAYARPDCMMMFRPIRIILH